MRAPLAKHANAGKEEVEEEKLEGEEEEEEVGEGERGEEEEVDPLRSRQFSELLPKYPLSFPGRAPHVYRQNERETKRQLKDREN